MESYYINIIICCRKRIQIKISQEKRHIGVSSLNMELPGVLSPSSHKQHGHVVGNMYRVLPTREGGFWCQEFLLGLNHILLTDMAHVQSPVLPGSQINTFSHQFLWKLYVIAQSPHQKSHCQTVQWLKPPYTQRHSYPDF